jgi:hypothetical protein
MFEICAITAGRILATAPELKPNMQAYTTVAAVPLLGTHKANVMTDDRRDIDRNTLKRPTRSARKGGMVLPNVLAAFMIATRYVARELGTWCARLARIMNVNGTKRPTYQPVSL